VTGRAIESGEITALGKLDSGVTDDAVRLRHFRRLPGALQHDHPDVMRGEFGGQEKAHRPGAADCDVIVLGGLK
jgi:hypothetical protein